ncbi:hypothetical protein SeMB42_g03398 [Synchytrium endobioticum]|uniref:Protein phosphatase inhibitor 2 n=1 Tax=Synchytrium endobioticum TaxID=286115 RepID=A0A507D6T7_9FUNG|nr:hypothetical protein SeLEV6574_g05779 [Synchytrium endobioticum]TPX47252.1 hypothetical protein SeMB42_g03398 [Synchytrium endobioticum]
MSDSGTPSAKGILKVFSSDDIASRGNHLPPPPHANDPHHHRSSRIKWDEDNIMMTEAAKSATMKITEPKTPYIHYNADTDQVLGTSHAIPPMELTQAMQSISDPPRSLSLSSTPSSVTSSRSITPTGSPAMNGGPGSSSDWDASDDEELAPEERERRRKFKKLRAQHYNMKETLRKAKQVLQHEDEVEENTRGKMG